MDTGLALQMARSLGAMDRRLGELGDALACRAEEHAGTVMAARTHAQQAVPTTFGATLGTLLAQFTRHRERLAQAAPRIAVISLFGAGGTAAALGPHSAAMRATMARRLGLHHTDVPWHVDRDGVAEFGWLCTVADRDVRQARAQRHRPVPHRDRRGPRAVREPPRRVVDHAAEGEPDLVGDRDRADRHGGRAGVVAGPDPVEAGHERAAGEWQIEWQVVPQLASLAGTALAETTSIARGMRVDAQRMRANLDQDGGLVMSEAQMISLAARMGREHAHDLVYEAAERARSAGRTLADVLPEVAREHGSADLLPDPLITADRYVGEAARIARTACAGWRATPPLNLAAADPSVLPE